MMRGLALQPEGDELRELRLRTYRLTRQREARLLSKSFPAFVRAAWPTIEPDRPLIWNWHYDYLGELLTLASRHDERARKLIVNVPPRTLKSILCTVLWPAWVWTWYARSRWMFISYSNDLTYQHSVLRRNLILSEWYRDRWDVPFAEDQNQKGQYDNDSGGRMISTSIGATVGGRGGDFLLFDDPNDPLNPESEADRKTAIEKSDTALATRLDDQATGVRIVIQQRTHQQDVTGHLLEEGSGWTHVKLPMEAEQEECISYPISGEEHRRAPGDLLFPDRFNAAQVAEMKALFRSSHRVSAQLQQRPTALEGGMLRRGWWQYYDADPQEMAKGMERVIQSWDMTFKEKDDSDFVVGQVWGKKGARCYLLDQVRARMDFPTTCRALISLSAKWPTALSKYVEDKANGPAVIAQLRAVVFGLLAVEPRGSKEARAAAVSGAIEAGNVWLPDARRSPAMHDFVEECAAFPQKGVPDDQVDAMSQALQELIGLGRQWTPEAMTEAMRQVELGAGIPKAYNVFVPDVPPALP